MIQQGFGGNKHKNGQLQSGYSPENQMFIYIYVFSRFHFKILWFQPIPSPSPSPSPAWSGYQRCGRRSGATNVQVSSMTGFGLVISMSTHGVRWFTSFQSVIFFRCKLEDQRWESYVLDVDLKSTSMEDQPFGSSGFPEKLWEIHLWEIRDVPLPAAVVSIPDG